MSNTELLYQLNKEKQNLVQQFQSEAVFSKERLQQLQRKARDAYDRTELLMCFGGRDLALQLQDKLRIGYRYEDHQAAALQLPNGNILLQLVKPEDVTESEIVELELKTKEQYLSDIAASNDRLVAETAEINIKIKAMEKLVTADIKAETDRAKELVRVQKELAGEVEGTNNV